MDSEITKLHTELAAARSEIERLQHLGLTHRQYFAAHCPPVPDGWQDDSRISEWDRLWHWRECFTAEMCKRFASKSEPTPEPEMPITREATPAEIAVLEERARANAQRQGVAAMTCGDCAHYVTYSNGRAGYCDILLPPWLEKHDCEIAEWARLSPRDSMPKNCAHFVSKTAPKEEADE